ncbi:MAG TPA: iron-sulfur cluster repair di-iron protein [Pyrinomonadaceae bacterium]|nr:iron-sulfur cluster repair di-iron protein [Pyrinomonadaceae bacterium]
MINSAMTVREVAVELPQSTRLFEKLKIDYCCGGNRPLTEACSEIGLEVGEVIGMLESVSESEPQAHGAVGFQKLPLPELIAHILDTHHVFTKREMTRLESLSQKVLAAHGVNHPELHNVSALFDALCADLKPHIFKEEQILFPYLLGLAQADSQNRPAPFAPFGKVNNPIRMMMTEHDAAGEILRELRTTTSDYSIPADGCISYRTLYEALDAFEKDLHHISIWRTTFSSHGRSSWKLG